MKTIGILDPIIEWLKEFLISVITFNLSNLFTDVNEKVGTIAAEVGQTPQAWNSSIYALIHNLSGSVMVPIGGIIISAVLCYELISMVISGNNLQGLDTWMFFKFTLKGAVAVYLLSHTWEIIMAIFDVGQHVVRAAAGVISTDTSIDITTAVADLTTAMATMELGELFALMVETAALSLCLKIMAILITVILYGRMIEIYLVTSVAPIPFATMTNREWGTIGTNYVKSLLALAFQGFLIMVCVGIYAVLVHSMVLSTDLHGIMFSIAAYTVLLCFCLFRTGSLAKSIFHAH